MWSSRTLRQGRVAYVPVRFRWLKKAWNDFRASADPDDLVANSNPILIAGSTGAPIILILALAYFPPLADISQLRHPWIASGLFLAGGILTYVAWLRRCRGTVGSLATLFDNAFYSSGLAVAAASCSEATGIALALIHGLMMVSFPARDYALTWLFSVMMTAPVLVVLFLVRPSLPVALVLVASLVMLHVVSQETRVKRHDKLRRLRLEQALGAADKLADESVQAALTTTLLTLGHFLHELRNYQTAIAANLEYVEASGQLSRGAKEALIEAQDAQRAQADLLRKTIDDLRGRGTGGTGSFLLRNTLDKVAAKERQLEVRVTGDLEYELQGNIEHFRVIMLNLIRNAAQAGAKRVECNLGSEPSGSAVRLVVRDDGRGILAEKRATLFDSFALSDKPGGSGLGLYLIRRYVELLGGAIEASENNVQGGATFVIRLPARAVAQENYELGPALT